MADLKASLVLGIKDRLTAPAKRIKRSLNDLAKSGRLAGRFRLLTRQSRKLGKQWRNMRGQAKGLLKGVGLLAGAAGGGAFALFRMAGSVANVGDNIAKTSRKLGLSVKELQQWRFAADRSDIGAQTFDMALQRFTRRAREAADGTGEARGALKFLGVELKDSEGNLRSRTDLLDDVAEAMSKIEDPALRVRVAFKLFDSEGVNMVNLLGEGKEAMQGLRKEASDLGLMTEKNAKDSEAYNDAMTNFKLIIGSVRDAVVGQLLPGMTDWLKLQTDLIKSGKKNFIGDLVSDIKSAVSGIKTFITTANNVVGVFGGWKIVLSAIAALIASKFLISLGGVILTLFKLGGIALPLVLKSMWLVVGVIKAMGVALLTNPIGLLVAAVAVSALLIVKYWKPIKTFFKGLFEDIKALFKDGFISGILRVLAGFNPAALIFKAISNVVKALTGFDLKAEGLRLMESLGVGIADAWSNISGWFTRKLSGFINLIPKPLRSRLGLSGGGAGLADPVRSSQSSSLPSSSVNANVGGLLKVVIDSEGRPKVTSLKKTGGMDIEASTGVMMTGAA